MVYLLVFIAVILMSISHVLVKKGMLAVGQFPGGIGDIIPFILKSYTNPYVISAVFATILTALVWILAISRAQLSYLYPFMALSYVLVALFSLFIFKEDISMMRWFGIIAICLGVFLVARS